MFFDFERAGELKRRGAERLAELDAELAALRVRLKVADAATRRRIELEADVIRTARGELDDSLAVIRREERRASRLLRSAEV